MLDIVLKMRYIELFYIDFPIDGAAAELEAVVNNELPNDCKSSHI